ncbi:TPA: deoxyribonuclease [Elizabethkingia meningoseptica]|uniref:TatD family hydrolase n=1 Tax=Elizabethkingia meningoseptica TaxID=238 RepID=UPI0022F1730E|nr:TatD family hydrolase [Elizabethkingia meningoseptica]EJK5328578.1 TatD family hydrolase [Elizabethkingia meningoseptica]WBS76430.1 TatD family hydrolase [Elizabethkingia meningoseptica]HAY3562284.1 deoxyribonuclease [Elizabethkingia meningoseptica]
MQFDFHHHHKTTEYHGIYNKSTAEDFYPEFFSVGLHPQDIGSDWLVKVRDVHQSAMAQKCLSIGECGLDAYVKTTLEEQIKVFKSQISIAEELNKPLTIHCVRRFNEVIQVCKDVRIPRIIHGFNKRETIAVSLLKNGFYLSFGVSLLNNLSLQNIFREIPQEMFVLETDTSDIGINTVYEKAARIRNISTEQLENIVDNNLKTIFGW